MSETNGTNGLANGRTKTPAVDISVALAPNDLKSVPGLVQDINSVAEKAAAGNENARLELVEKARSLVRALETPRETMIKHCWAQPSAMAALSTGIDVGLFSLLAEDGGSAKNAKELAAKLGMDPPLLCRLMRHLAAMGYIIETGEDEYKPTNFSSSLSIPVIGDGYTCISGALMMALCKFPEYAKKTNYKTPNSLTDGPLQYAYNTQLNMFEHLMAHPPYGEQFNHHMGGYRQGRPSWMDRGFYPVEERLIQGARQSPDAPFLVDIGGGVGHDLDEFRRKVPHAPGRLVLEDLAPVIDQAHARGLDSRIETLVYNFYTEQPVKGARAYYMHSTLHDWPDAECVKILARVKEAMAPGYSRLLINENVIPPRGAQWEATALDIMMLTLLSSRERTEADWYSLLQDQAGLRITGIYTAQNGVESIIECELA
ncbi:hypothetical protein C8A03DRAFT_39595 [Achaetomium macrosporum]|uniref:O-methyltransferase domain-containing protein n=1 Tax=Achaetomium macrosporum TaxID=79813 RepID=A0AAN7H5S0_9PEZI|nr:hypothetical protein C8A03DRAFT_39595 [Achaetomium macrosporum]